MHIVEFLKEIKKKLDAGVSVSINGNKVEVIRINKDNLPSAFYTPGFFEPRDTNNKILYLEHANIGVFDRVIGIRNTTDATFQIAIKTIVNAGDGDKTGATVWEGTLPKDARWYFAPDKGDFDKGSTTQKCISVVELRLPYPTFVIDIKANELPTTGEIMLVDVRRY